MKPKKVMLRLTLLLLLFPVVTEGAISGGYYCEGKFYAYTAESEYKECMHFREQRIKAEEAEAERLVELKQQEEEDALNKKIQEAVEDALEKERSEMEETIKAELEKERLRVEEELRSTIQAPEPVETGPSVIVESVPAVTPPASVSNTGKEVGDKDILPVEDVHVSETPDSPIESSDYEVESEVRKSVWSKVTGFFKRLFGRD